MPVKKKVLILGGTGFVGRNVAEVLTENGINYSICSRRTGVDIRNASQMSEYLAQVKPDFIVNCAAHVGSLNYVTEQAAEVIMNNSRMILSMYEAVAKNSPQAIIINPVANCAYPAKSNIFIEDEWWDGHLHRSVLPYGSTKRLLWTVGESFAMQYNLKSIYLLVPNMYGPYDSTDPNKAHALNALISKFVKAEASGEKEVLVWGTGVAIREWLYAKDFGRIVMQILLNPDIEGLTEPINVAQNFGLSIKELVAIIVENFNFSGRIKWDHSKPDGAPKKVMDDIRFRKSFPEFLFTDFGIGIKNAVEYYKQQLPY